MLNTDKKKVQLLHPCLINDKKLTPGPFRPKISLHIEAGLQQQPEPLLHKS